MSIKVLLGEAFVTHSGSMQAGEFLRGAEAAVSQLASQSAPIELAPADAADLLHNLDSALNEGLVSPEMTNLRLGLMSCILLPLSDKEELSQELGSKLMLSSSR